MTQENQANWITRLNDQALCRPIEQCVSDYLGRPWQTTQVHDKSDRASHPAATLSDGDFTIFVKLGVGAQAADQFEKEVAGLRLLTARAGAPTPTVIATLPIDGSDEMLVVMAAVTEIIAREPIHFEAMGRTLAQVHLAKGVRFGLETHCYWGSLYQDNSPLDDWPEFFWQRRMAPRLKAAAISGNLPLDLVSLVERLQVRLVDLCGPTMLPTLLHGDAHQNNFLNTSRGTLLIDPSVYYGHPEIDLAHIDYFEPVPAAFWQGYQAINPIDPGFAQRRDLWRVPTWLAMIEGAWRVEEHLNTLTAYLRRFE